MVPGFYETAQHNVFKDFLKSHSHFFALTISWKYISNFLLNTSICQFFVLNAINSHFFLLTICRIIFQIYWCILKFVSLNQSIWMANLPGNTLSPWIIVLLWKPKRSRDQLVLTTYFDPVLVLYLKARGVRQHCYKKKAATVGQNGRLSAICNFFSFWLKKLWGTTY